MKHKKLLSLLVLLMAAVTGAWADIPTFDQTIFESDAQLGQIYVTEDTEITIADNVIVTIDGGLVIVDEITLTVNGPGTLIVNGKDGSNPMSLITLGEPGEPGNSGGIAIKGNIIVNGATVQAKGGNGGNGGSGCPSNSGPGPVTNATKGGVGGQGGTAILGTVTINSGIITATGGNGGQGGTGGDDSNGGNGGKGGNGGTGGYAFDGKLTVIGGNVTAQGGNGGQRGQGGTNADAGYDGPAGKAFAGVFDLTLANENAKMYKDEDQSEEIASIVDETFVCIVASDVQPVTYDYTFTTQNAQHCIVKFFIEGNENAVKGAMLGDEGKTITVTIKPKDDWTIGSATATTNINWEGAGARRMDLEQNPTIDMLGNVTLTPVTNTEVPTWTFEMPSSSVMVGVKYEPRLAWKQNGTALKDPATVNYCEGFPFTSPVLDNPDNLEVTYTVEDTNVSDITLDDNGKVTVSDGATPGSYAITATYPGDDDSYTAKTLTYTLVVTQPLNLTVNQTDHGTVTVEGLDGGITITAEDKGKVICTDGSIFATAQQAENSGKSPVAMIVGIDNNKGLAIGLYDLNEYSVKWTGANEGCNGLNQNYPVTDGTWSLPSVAQWKTMFKAFGDNEFRNNGLNMALVNAGGFPLLFPEDNEARYWSTENDEDKADYVILTHSEGSNITYNITDKSEYCYVRPILTFDLATANVIATETAGVYKVIPGTSVNLKAEADEGYNVAGWKNGTTAVTAGVTYDDYLDEENSRMPATSTLVLPLSANATISAQFTENEYNVTFLAQNKFNIKGGGAKVLVDNTDKTNSLDHNSDGSESKLGVKYGKTVKLKANQGYKLRKVKAKEILKETLMSITIPLAGSSTESRTLYYAEGETWEQAVSRPINENAGWKTTSQHVYYDDYRLFPDVLPSHKINPNVSYYLSNAY